MKKEDIPGFVAEIAATGCNIVALVDSDNWFIGDADLTDHEYEAVKDTVAEISKRYGDREHLTAEIASYLREIGRIPDFDKQ